MELKQTSSWNAAMRVFLLVSVVIWVVAEIGIRYWRHVNTGDPGRMDLLLPLAGHYDFGIFKDPFDHFRTEQFYAPHDRVPFAYPATSGVILAFFYKLFSQPYVVFSWFSYTVPIGALILTAVAFVRRGVRPIHAALALLATYVMSYPFQFEWQRSNIEIVIFFVSALALVAYWRGWHGSAAALIGFITAAKLYPFILLGLLFSKRKYKEVAIGVVVAIATNALSLWVLGPTYRFANESIKLGLATFRNTFFMAYMNLGYDHSLLALLKCFLHHPQMSAPSTYSSTLTAYMATMAVGGVLLYILRIRYLPRTNQVIALVVISILIPPISYDYTLIHLYLCWAVLALYVTRPGTATTPVLWMFALFAVLMSPEGPIYFMDIRISGQIKCMALIALLGLALKHPLAENAEPICISDTAPMQTTRAVH